MYDTCARSSGKRKDEVLVGNPETEDWKIADREQPDKLLSLPACP